MFPKATLLAIITLVITAAAVPVQRPAGISVPLHKRGGLTTTEGVFDRSKAIRASVITSNKVRQNLMSKVANGGTLHKGAWIKDLAVTPSEFVKRQNEPLIDEDNDTEWAGTVSIGTPPKEFLIDFDSTYRARIYSSSVVLTHSSLAGSSDLWVPSVDCNVAACAQKNKFDASQSSTSKAEQGNFTIQYGDGSSVTGPVFTETVSVAGIQVTNQAFSPATTISDSFGKDPIDGVSGFMRVAALCEC